MFREFTSAAILLHDNPRTRIYLSYFIYLVLYFHVLAWTQEFTDEEKREPAFGFMSDKKV